MRRIPTPALKGISPGCGPFNHNMIQVQAKRCSENRRGLSLFHMNHDCSQKASQPACWYMEHMVQSSNRITPKPKVHSWVLCIESHAIRIESHAGTLGRSQALGTKKTWRFSLVEEATHFITSQLRATAETWLNSPFCWMIWMFFWMQVIWLEDLNMTFVLVCHCLLS